MKKLPTIERLTQLLALNGGTLYWKESRGRVSAGSIAGSPGRAGAPHSRIRIDGEVYLLHRVVWALANGRDPFPLDVDHINRDASDNRPENLRAATRQENSRNTAPRPGGTSKYIGVSWASGKWRAAIRDGSGTRYLGRYRDEVDAAMAYDSAAKEIHGEFASLNFPGEAIR